MNAKLIVLCIVFADFVGLTAYAVYHHGYLAFIPAFFGDAIAVQVFFDLVIALSFFMIWMWRDAREHEISPLPYTGMILFLGSIGALAYLIHRELRLSRPATVAAMPSAAVAPRA